MDCEERTLLEGVVDSLATDALSDLRFLPSAMMEEKKEILKS
jgi:hypothetical protein